MIGDDNNRHFGLLDVAGKPKPALAAMQLWNRLVDQPVRRIPATATGKSKATVYAFEKQDRTVVVAAWLAMSRRGQSTSDGLKADEAREAVPIRVAFPRAGTLEVYTREGDVVHDGPAFRDGVIEDVELKGSGIFLALLKAAAP